MREKVKIDWRWDGSRREQQLAALRWAADGQASGQWSVDAGGV